MLIHLAQSAQDLLGVEGVDILRLGDDDQHPQWLRRFHVGGRGQIIDAPGDGTAGRQHQREVPAQGERHQLPGHVLQAGVPDVEPDAQRCAAGIVG